jgi:hypothetical protein
MHTAFWAEWGAELIYPLCGISPHFSGEESEAELLVHVTEL